MKCPIPGTQHEYRHNTSKYRYEKEDFKGKDWYQEEMRSWIGFALEDLSLRARN